MKKIMATIFVGLMFFSAFAQVKVVEGPELNNEEENKMNRMINGENGEFYSYRIRTKGKGTSFFIEKFEKSSLKAIFSKEVPVPTENTKILDVRYAAGKVYVIYRTYIKESETMTLNYETVSSAGVVSTSGKEFFSRKTDRYEFIDFDITNNSSNTKIAIKTTYKASKDDQYKTDFVLFDAVTQKIAWTKTVPKYLKRSNPWFVWSFKAVESTGFLGFILNENDDIYYAFNEKLKKDDKKDERYNAAVEILKSESKTPVTVKLDLNPEYLVYDIKFSMNKQNNLVIAGFFKDIIERKGRDLVDVGVFSYKINYETAAVLGKSVKIFDDKILAALESNQKRARNMIYKADYLLPNGDDFYLVGEQYTVAVGSKQGGTIGTISNVVALSSGANPFYVGKVFIYEYMDVIVGKINAKGDFEWIANSPLRNGTTTTDNPHVFKQYIATTSSKGVYLFYNTHVKNAARLAKADYEPKDLKTSVYIHGTNFVYSKITPDGKVVHDIAFKNETYCFAPIQERNIKFLPPEDAEIFVGGGADEIFIYLEDRGKGRFCKVDMK
ncbi:MAG: hypothetical protein NVV82_25885 [Sporocytophaga sp.]|nr:hypothetical protein [Sporocytophaga sp.]